MVASLRATEQGRFAEPTYPYFYVLHVTRILPGMVPDVRVWSLYYQYAKHQGKISSGMVPNVQVWSLYTTMHDIQTECWVSFRNRRIHRAQGHKISVPALLHTCLPGGEVPIQ